MKFYRDWFILNRLGFIFVFNTYSWFFGVTISVNKDELMSFRKIITFGILLGPIRIEFGLY